MSIENNPLLNEAGNKYNSVPFSKIKAEHFIPALNHSIEQAKKIINGMLNLFIKKDASLIEINPLIITDSESLF